MLFVIAWSSVGFNLKSVYQPVMQVLVGFEGREGKREEKGKSKTIDKSSEQAMSAVAPMSTETGSDAFVNKSKINKANSIAYLTEQAHIAAQKKRRNRTADIGYPQAYRGGAMANAF